MNIFLFIFVLLCNVLLLYFFYKKNFFVDEKKNQHKLFVSQNRNNYLLGGLYLIIFNAFFFITKNPEYFFVLLAIFFLGIFSDLRINENPKIRFVLQILIIFFLLKISNTYILDTRINTFNEILKINFVSICFTIFCLMIFLNGVNFIDGINTLSLLYLIVVVAFMLSLNLVYDFKIDLNYYIYLFILLIFIIILNYFGLVFLGDSGAYLSGAIIGLELIKIANDNIIISPYYVILLLLYPCFEILFSITRRLINNNKSYKPDNLHLHQLLYQLYANQKIFSKLNTHLVTSLSINFVVFLFVFLGFVFVSQTKIIVLLIIFKLLTYLISYYFLKKLVL
jgi:UDP-N-acetylmuramyl pentapeptide phosphotransferase/UDP-N-acetylglucosamine-1-phosphate transferase